MASPRFPGPTTATPLSHNPPSIPVNLYLALALFLFLFRLINPFLVLMGCLFMYVFLYVGVWRICGIWTGLVVLLLGSREVHNGSKEEREGEMQVNGEGKGEWG
ncbi:hypothetical protein BZA05DRAFT_397755 [Tricharina praecox]|uniref:uncharacterized protein n=1 Tax=Tricharina praecox TaxID=43433 RepID=UPI00221F25B0|nr:uncharacterized protein BZA05DRAFT_397755 [Tricharina praecox]KAI5852387.1 hypothetical protein BZA05DRAFT_397755 [Tricharina praecox]